jgi:predicted phosphoadenosine phosphosulfate sulfurtransferase
MGTRKKIKKYIDLWESRCYPEGIPDEAPIDLESAGLVPSYKRICKALLKNDNNLEELGYSRPKCEAYNEIKRIEILLRNECTRSSK